MKPPHYISIGPVHFIFRWGHDWVPNGMKDGTEYTCWRCSQRKVGKPYEVHQLAASSGFQHQQFVMESSTYTLPAVHVEGQHWRTR